MSEQYTLIEFLNKYEVRVPIIQRDYAQGRSDEKGNEVRKKLILDMKNSLMYGKQIDFNFVYGTSKEKANKVEEFYPVDGQQRLTSLYLLHWYLACFDDANLKDFNGKHAFSYKTRNSATEFFAILHKPPSALKQIVRERKGSLKEKIMNEAWFQAEWANDPTVDAVLTFLNDLSMEKEFRGKETACYQRLNEHNEKLFYFTVIVEEGDRAETKAAKSYIRMNARGKALEQFENVKAMLDSIEEKINKKNIEKKLPKITDFISRYDISYINELFSAAGTMNLKDKTEKINAESLNYLMKLYLLLGQWQKRLGRISFTRAQFVSEIYEYSHSGGEEHLEFFIKYFQLLIAIFEYYIVSGDKENAKGFFELEEESDFCMSEDRTSSAIALYIYYYYVTQKKTLEKIQMEKFLYVLENLKYRNWSAEHFVEILDKVAKLTAQKSDIFECFIRDEDVSIMQEALKDSALLDYQVRIKEQSIKAKLCADKQLSWDFFKELEDRSWGVRKIQYLLYISGYWENYSQGDYYKLNQYVEIARKYFGVADKELVWRKYYAVAVHTKDGAVSTAKEINELYTRENCRYHIWEDRFYFWSDEEDDTIRSLALPYVKWIYEQLSVGQNIVATITADQENYGKCWLYHALEGHHEELLKIPLRWNADVGIIYALDDFKEGHRYDLYIRHIERKMWYGIWDLVLKEVKRHTFWANHKYVGRVVDPYQNYNVSLSLRSEIIGVYPDKQAERRGFYKPIQEGDKIIFTVFEAKEPYHVVETCYDITEERKKAEAAFKALENMVVSYTEQEWLDIMDDKHSDWKRPRDMRVRTWNYCGDMPMKIPYVRKQ